MSLKINLILKYLNNEFNTFATYYQLPKIYFLKSRLPNYHKGTICCISV